MYEFTNHLGNVLTTVSDIKLSSDANSDGFVDSYSADITSSQDYYPFGMLQPGRDWNADNYRFGFNGKENDNEVKGIGNSVDYGARMYDPRLGRWLKVDPKKEMYAGYSPYNFALNTPIQAYDPDGRLVIFVNGFRLQAYQDYLLGFGKNPGMIPPWMYRGLYSNYDIYGSDLGESYWYMVDDFVMERHNDFNAIYVDGGYKPQSTAQDRYNRGVADAYLIAKEIEAGNIVLEAGETIKLVGHSHGGWHAIGMADYLIAAGYNVEVTYVKNPHQPNQKVRRIGAIQHKRLVQYSTQSDYVSSDQTQLFHLDLRAGHADFSLNIGDWFVGDSEYAIIPFSTEFVRLPDAWNMDLDGHNVYNQSDFIAGKKPWEKGYVGHVN